MIGQTLDHYRIESKLGEGGMGVVYKARDTRLNRPVAIKILSQDRVSHPPSKARFVQEAKAASALNHPHIVTVHDIRSEGEVDFMVMEFVEGRTLTELIPAQGLPSRDAMRYAVQMADALAKAHTAGILHRDLKPSNLMIAEGGRVKILDFGLAKLLEAEAISPEDATVTVRHLTEEGTVAGTLAYMSPEQAEGRKLDARSDIFSFGSLLYEMITGRRPFTGDTRLSVLHKIVNADPPPPRQFSGSIPPELEKVTLRCLRKDPARRFQSMMDLKVALEDIIAEPTPAKHGRTARILRAPRLALVLGSLLIVGFLGWRASRRPEGPEPLRATPLSTQPGVHQYPSLSPDGNYVAFTWAGPRNNNPDIYVQQIGSGAPFRRTMDPANDFNPVWSPDGGSIAFLRRQTKSGGSDLLLIPPLGGPERRLADIRPHQPEPRLIPPYLAWCPDGKCLLASDSSGEAKPDALFVVGAETGEKRQLTHPQPPVLGDSTPAISPDGRSLVFYRNISSGVGELHWLPLTKDLKPDGESRRLTSVALNAKYPAWTPDGKEILFSAESSLWRLAVPGGGPPKRLAFVGDDGIMPAISPGHAGRNARLVYVRSFDDSNVWRIETSASGMPSAAAPQVAISSTRADYAPQFSPDGRRVAFSSTRSGDMEIWIADPDGGNAIRLTSLKAKSLRASWSPDGRTIVFDSNAEGQFDLYVIPASGGRPRRITSHPDNEQVPSYSRDGKWIYFTSNRSGDHQIWKIPSAGGEAIQVTNNMGVQAYEYGAHLYYTQTTSVEVSGLWRMQLSGGVPVKLFDGVIRRTFAVFDKGIYYFDQAEGGPRLRFYDFATGKAATIAQNPGNVTSGITVTPDGRTILYCRIDSSVDDLMLVENFR